MVKVKNIKDIPWYNFTIVRHTNTNMPIRDHWSKSGFSKRLFIDYSTNLVYTLSSEIKELNKVYSSNIINDMSYDLEDGSKSYCVEFFIENDMGDICGYAQKVFNGVDVTIFSLIVDPVYSVKAVNYFNKWKNAVNKRGFFWDLTECRIDENNNIQPIDLDEGIFDSNRDEWPWWTQERKNEEWASPTDIQDTLSYSGYYVGENFDWDNINSDNGYNKNKIYALTNLFRIMLTVELNNRLKSKDYETISLACHPGVSITNIVRNFPKFISNPVVVKLLNKFLFQSPDKASKSALVAALNPSVNGGDFIGFDTRKQYKGSPKIVSPNQLVFDEKLRQKLWDISVEITGIELD